jgi:hypothetical protein
MTTSRALGSAFALFALAAAAALSVACATLRSDFESRGEEPLFGIEATSLPSFWEFDHAYPGLLARAEGDKPGALRILSSPGGAALPDSLVSDFRMEFSVRLEGESQAMINFRNYFTNRYCVIIQPEWLELRVARAVHSDLQVVKGTRVDAAAGTWHRYEIVAVGPLVRVFKEGKLLLEAEVADPPSGTGNIWFESHQQYSFADVRVARIKDFVKIDKKAAQAQPALASVAPSERAALAVSGFEALGVAGYEASLLCDLYADALLKTGLFRVLDRSELAALLPEQELRLSGLTSPEGAAEVGRLMNARYLSTGSAGLLGAGYAVNVRIMDVESGETVASAAGSFPDAGSAASAMRELAAEIAKAFAARR